MPEGPELYKASTYVNNVCSDRVFAGKIVKSAVSLKNPDIVFDAKGYTIRAESRGKEMALILAAIPENSNTKCHKKEKSDKCIRIRFQFGMSGKFLFSPVDELHKHAHLQFYTKGKPAMALCFVDTRRFGKWEVSDTWSASRGPDPVFEYKAFRSNVLDNLTATVFSKPLCEVLHDQRFFNGIGNYLRAEIIYRAGIPPFTCARSILEKLQIKQERDHEACSATQPHVQPDLLELCHIVPKEVIDLTGSGYDPSGNQSDYTAFCAWLRCYCNLEMNNLVDHDGRTMWFKGEPGEKVPRKIKERHLKKKGAKVKENDEAENGTEDQPSTPKKAKVEVEQITEPIKEQKQQSKKTTKQNNTRKRKSVLASELVENPGTREKTRKANITTTKKEGKLKPAVTKKTQKSPEGNTKRSFRTGSTKTSSAVARTSQSRTKTQKLKSVKQKGSEHAPKVATRRSSRIKS